MSAKSDARKQFAKEQELEKLRLAKERKLQARVESKTASVAKLAAMTDVERTAFNAAKQKHQLIGIGVVAALVVALIAFGVSNSNSTGVVVSSTPSASATHTPDAGSQLACDHFRNVMSDAGAGLLTDIELRSKIKEVYSDAWVSTESGIATSAQAMLAAITSGDVAEYTTALGKFAGACTAIGH